MAKTRFFQKLVDPKVYQPDSIYFIADGVDKITIIIANDKGIARKLTLLEFDWDKLFNVPTTFPAIAHNHVEADITDLDKYTQSQVVALIAAATSPAISDNYNDITALLSAQGTQEENFLYMVLDATIDTTVDLGWALYQKLTATTANLTDYRKLSEEESMDVIAGPTSPTTTLGDMILRGATEDERLPIGVDGSVLQVDLAQPNKIKWSVLDSFKYARYMNTSLQSADSVTAFALQWNVIEYEDSDYSLVANQITINTNGIYLINANIDLYGTTTVLRYGGEVKILINGLELPNIFRGGYVRGDSGHYVSQIFVGIMLQLSEGDTIDFTLKRTHSLSTNIIVQNGTTLSIGKLSGGIKGEKGDAGIQGTSGGTPTIVSDTDDTIDLSNWLGNNCNQLSPNTNDTFIFVNEVEGGWSRILIDTTGKVGFPLLTGGEVASGNAFQIDYLYDMFVEYVGGIARYSFIEFKPAPL